MSDDKYRVIVQTKSSYEPIVLFDEEYTLRKDHIVTVSIEGIAIPVEINRKIVGFMVGDKYFRATAAADLQEAW